MRRQTIKGTRIKGAANPDAEPNFYAMVRPCRKAKIIVCCTHDKYPDLSCYSVVPLCPQPPILEQTNPSSIDSFSSSSTLVSCELGDHDDLRSTASSASSSFVTPVRSNAQKTTQASEKPLLPGCLQKPPRLGTSRAILPASSKGLALLGPPTDICNTPQVPTVPPEVFATEDDDEAVDALLQSFPLDHLLPGTIDQVGHVLLDFLYQQDYSVSWANATPV